MAPTILEVKLEVFLTYYVNPTTGQKYLCIRLATTGHIYTTIYNKSYFSFLYTFIKVFSN